MVKIAESKGRQDENSGFTRLFGNPQLGHLMSKVQATVIRSGNELEKILEEKTPSDFHTNIETLLHGLSLSSKKFVVFSPSIPKIDDKPGARGDILIIDNYRKEALIVEVKDGDTFDTKKASGELVSLQRFASWFKEQSGINTNYAFCSFNQDNKSSVVAGAKGRFDEAHVLTGRELCDLLCIDYDEIRINRKKEQPENLRFFIDEILKIPEILALIKQKMGIKNGN